jgi:carboxyl-terminal processing protease
MKRSHFIRMCIAGLILVFVLCAGCSQAPRQKPLTDGERLLHIDSFEQVWRTIRDRHWDESLGGLNWQEIHDELLPKVEAATTETEAIVAIREMISRLDQSHFGIISANMYEDLGESVDDVPKAQDGWSGFDVRIIEGRATVTSVETGSSAESEGVATGWIVERIGERKIDPLLAKIETKYTGKPSRLMMMTMSVQRRLRGKIGETVKVTFLDGEDKKTTKALALGPLPGKAFRFGNMPSVNVSVDTTEVAPDIHCVAFNYFFDPASVMAVYNTFITNHIDAKGLIIDLRGNPGGLGGMAMGMSGWFVEEKGQQLGTMYTRASKLKFIISPRGQSYTGPLVLLVDGLSASTSEIMAGGLKDIGRARILGRTTAGAALPSVVERLPNGSGFQYAFANYISSGGDVLEGNGVVPDEYISPSREELLANRDPVIEAALAWINGQYETE